MIKKIARRLINTGQYMVTGRLTGQKIRQILPITSDEIEEVKAFFPLEKFFIFGHARSGTTLLTRLIRLHDDVHCNYQAHFFSNPPLISDLAADKKIGDWFSRKSNRWNQGADMTAISLRAMMDFIMERDARKKSKTIVGDKSPNVNTNGDAVVEMSKYYPDGKVIYIVRDGRDTLISHRFQNFIDGYKFLPAEDLQIREDFAKDPAPYFAGEKSIFTDKAIRRMSRGWVKNVVDTHQRGQEIYEDQYYSLRYEDMLADPYGAISKVWAFLGASSENFEERVTAEMTSNPDADWQKQQAGDLVSNLKKGKKGSWKQLFTARDKQVFKEIAGETLIKWGYAEDNNW